MRVLCLLLLLASAAGAHDFWIKPSGVLWYGHEDESAAYAPDKVKKALALSAAGKPVGVKRSVDGGKVKLTPEGEAAQLAVEIDTGYWSKTAQGWQNKPKSQSSQVIMAEWSLYYSKLLYKPEGCLNKPFGQKLEIVPVQVSANSVKVKVLLEGKPQEGLKLYVNHERVGEANSAGEATLERRGLTIISVSFKQPVEGNAEYDRLNLNAVLTLP